MFRMSILDVMHCNIFFVAPTLAVTSRKEEYMLLYFSCARWETIFSWANFC